MKTNRYSIGTKLSTPKTIALTVGMTCYLGASSSPDTVTITSITDTMIGYELAGAALRIERWIGEDLIATGSANVRRQLREFLATEFGRDVNRNGDISSQIAKLDALLG